MAKLREFVNGQHLLHKFTLQNEHGVRRVNGDYSWKKFQPTDFIYAFFVFNSIYSVDWETSVKKGAVIEWNIQSNNEKDNLTESQKISRLVGFCFDCLDINAAYYYHDKLVNCLDENINPLEELKHITDDFRTRDLSKTFQKCFADVYNQANQSKGNKKKALNSILYFIYLVRCNIFHGTKTTIEMLDGGQQNRLRIYTAILFASNDLLFKSIYKTFEN